jgi:hypothetical protein
MKLKQLFTRENFNDRPLKKILAFTTQGGHVSGKLMKQIEFRSPEVIDKLKDKISQGNSIGDVIVIDTFIFVVYKKHYNTKMNRDKFEAVLKIAAPNINKYRTKITNEDWPDYQDLILQYIPSIEYRETSEWGVYDPNKDVADITAFINKMEELQIPHQDW